MITLVFFLQFDQDGSGMISSNELGGAFAKIGQQIPGYKLREMINSVDQDENGSIQFEEFVQVSFCNYRGTYIHLN